MEAYRHGKDDIRLVMSLWIMN